MMTKTTAASLAACIALAVPMANAAEFAPAGAQLAVGDAAVLPVRIPYGPQVPVRVTVTAIDAGTLADFEGYKLPPAATEMKPYYVRYTVTALGNGNLSGLGIGYTLTASCTLTSGNSITVDPLGGAHQILLIGGASVGKGQRGDGSGKDFQTAHILMSFASLKFRERYGV